MSSQTKGADQLVTVLTSYHMFHFYFLFFSLYLEQQFLENHVPGGVQQEETQKLKEWKGTLKNL